jgi:hypothetical protein
VACRPTPWGLFMSVTAVGTTCKGEQRCSDLIGRISLALASVGCGSREWALLWSGCWVGGVENGARLELQVEQKQLWLRSWENLVFGD